MATKNGIFPEFWTKGKSPLLDSWSLFRDPSTISLIVFSYVAFVLYAGPKLMSKRKPFNLKYVIIVYNAFQVYYNFWVLQMVTFGLMFWKNLFSFGCAQMTPQEVQRYDTLICVVFWHMTVNKIMDLLDTVFFILCKKENHITFLHVQHHVLSVSVLWIVGKYFTGQEFTVILLCNTIVHMIMYFYYLIAALGPEYRKYLWWKKYLTIIQLVQFVIVIFYTIASLWFSCGYDQRIILIVILNALLNLVLFLNFYLKTYGSNKLLSEKVAVCGSLQFTNSYTETKLD